MSPIRFATQRRCHGVISSFRHGNVEMRLPRTLRIACGQVPITSGALLVGRPSTAAATKTLRLLLATREVGSRLSIAGRELVNLLTSTCLLGSACFSFASYVYVLEASHSSSLRWLSDEPVTLGYVVSWFNLLGSLCFFLASCCYFIQVPPYEGLTAGGEWGWEYQVSEWGVRFTYGFGSFLFVVASLVVFKELDRNAAE